MSNFLSELRRRNIFRVAGVYAVVAWLLAQMASVLESSMNMPDWFDTMIVSCLMLGLPVSLILAWAFEMAPEGMKRTEAASPDDTSVKGMRGFDYILLGGLVLVAVLIIGNRLVPKEADVSDGLRDEKISDGTIDAVVPLFAGQSIAVLPFEDFSPGQDQAYFADGIAEELLNVLARVKGLRVASRTSAFSYKGREASISEIGTALNVNHILEGSVRKAGETLRITAQLIDTKTDQHLWSETYDRPLTAENIFVIQDDISKAIVLELNGRLDLLPETGERLTQSTEALEAYLKGKEAYGPRNADGIEKGITELIRAVTLDPEFAVAHAKLARAYILAEYYADLALAYAAPRAQIHIEQAMTLAPRDWDVLSERAWWLEAKRSVLNDPDLTIDDVVAAFDVAIAANPNNAEAHRGRGWTLINTERLDEAKASLMHAYTLNPRDANIPINLSGIARVQNDLEALKTLSEEAVRLAPESIYNQVTLARFYIDLGDVETAHRILQSCRTDNFCASRLGILQLQLGFDVIDPQLLNDFATLNKYYFSGDLEAFAQTVPKLSGPPLMMKVDLYASVGEWDKGYQLIKDNPATFEALLQGSTATVDYIIREELILLETLEHQSNPKKDPRAKALRSSLTKKYAGLAPAVNANAEVYQNGTRWRLLNDDLDGAMEWLNALADTERPETIHNYGVFEPLGGRADFQALVSRFEGYRARDRALLEAQLANPPKIWWSPAELEVE